MTAIVADRPIAVDGEVDEVGENVPVAASRSHAWRRAWLYAWPTLLIVSVYSRFGGTSLASPDDGFILAQSRRILNGQIPHRDFISPRPAGSALLHCIDFLIPLPLLSASRLVSTVEVVAYTLLFASLAFRKPLRDWSLVQVAGAGAAVFVNLHSFPLMAWHTIDGIFLIAVGVVLLRNGLDANRTARICGGLLLLGSAIVVKQSFAPALVLGVAMVWESRRRTGSGRVSTARAALIVAAPMALYVLIIAMAGGFGPMITQMTNAKFVYGWSLIRGLWRSGGQGSILAAAAISLCLIDAHAGSSPAARRFASLSARGGLSALVVGVPLVTHTDPADAWGRELFFLLIVVVAWEWIRRGFVDKCGFVMVATGWMVSLSWGYPSPRLVAGSIALLLLDRLWRDAPAFPAGLASKLARVTTALVVATALAVMATAIHERALLNAEAATGDLSVGSTVPDLRGLRTDLSTTTLIRDVAACRSQFPAHWTAVLPGPAIVAPVMHLENPFSVDWVYPLEIHGSEARLVQEARHLDGMGDYLVLVVRPDPSGQTAPNPVLERMLAELSGTRTRCGNFTAIHSA